MSAVRIYLPDNSFKEFDHEPTVLEVANSIGPRLAKDTLGGKVEGESEILDLRFKLKNGSKLKIITSKDPERYVRQASHMGGETTASESDSEIDDATNTSHHSTASPGIRYNNPAYSSATSLEQMGLEGDTTCKCCVRFVSCAVSRDGAFLTNVLVLQTTKCRLTCSCVNPCPACNTAKSIRPMRRLSWPAIHSPIHIHGTPCRGIASCGAHEGMRQSCACCEARRRIKSSRRSS